MITKEHIGQIVRLKNTRNWYHSHNGGPGTMDEPNEYRAGILCRTLPRATVNGAFWAVPLSDSERWIPLSVGSHGSDFEPLS